VKCLPHFCCFRDLPTNQGHLSYCQKIRRDPTETLRLCDAAIFKVYLEHRVKKFRIKKESSIKGYWRRILSKYTDVAGHGMNNGTELDIRDVQFAPFSAARLA